MTSNNSNTNTQDIIRSTITLRDIPSGAERPQFIRDFAKFLSQRTRENTGINEIDTINLAEEITNAMCENMGSGEMNDIARQVGEAMTKIGKIDKHDKTMNRMRFLCSRTETIKMLWTCVSCGIFHFEGYMGGEMRPNEKALDEAQIRIIHRLPKVKKGIRLNMLHQQILREKKAISASQVSMLSGNADDLCTYTGGTEGIKLSVKICKAKQSMLTYIANGDKAKFLAKKQRFNEVCLRMLDLIQENETTELLCFDAYHTIKSSVKTDIGNDVAVGDCEAHDYIGDKQGENYRMAGEEIRKYQLFVENMALIFLN